MGIVIIVLILAIAGLVWWRYSTENRLRRIAVKIDESFSDIDIALIRRYDTLTKMRDICKQYLKHEKETLTEVVALRNGMSLSESKAANDQMSSLLGQLNVAVEAYPELKSDAQYLQLQKTIWDIETQLQSARRIYNSNVSAYNQLVVSFPDRIIAEKLGLTQKDFFETDDVHKFEDVNMN